ncbi:hypothetical protein KI387_028139, partial [Taxus chinensis]
RLLLHGGELNLLEMIDGYNICLRGYTREVMDIGGKGFDGRDDRATLDATIAHLKVEKAALEA